MADLLQTLSVILFVAAAVCLLAAIFLWFFLKIPTVIGNLSGRTAKKTVEERRKANERSGHKSYRPSSTNAARGKLTATMPQQPQQKPDPNARPDTGVLLENKADSYTEDRTELLCAEAPTEQMGYSGETAPLDGSAETAPLDYSAETAPLDGSAETAPLDDSGETAPLTAETFTQRLASETPTQRLASETPTQNLHEAETTAVLIDSEQATTVRKTPGGKKLTMIQNLMLIHTNEVLQ